MLDLSVPLQGMARAESNAQKAATRIAQAPLSVAAPPDSTDAVDLSAEIVALMQARNDYSASANVARTLDELSRSILDVLA